MNAPPSPESGFVLDLSGIDFGPEPEPEPEAERFARILAGEHDADDRAWIAADPRRRAEFVALLEAKRAALEAARAAEWEASRPEREAAEARRAEEEARAREEQERRAAEYEAKRAAHRATLDRQPFLDALHVVELDPVWEPGRNRLATLIAAAQQGQWFAVRIICPNPACKATNSLLSQSDHDGSLLVSCGGKRRGEENIECAGPVALTAMVEALVADLREERDEIADDEGSDLIEDGFDALFSAPEMESYLGDETVGVLAARGQSLAIVGRDGTGKTTLAHQIAKGCMGLPGHEEFVSFPIRSLPDGQRVLVLALDRPEQIRTAFVRDLSADNPETTAILRNRLVWVTAKDLPEGLVLASPEGTAWLLDLCRAQHVGLVIVDSPKDAVDGDLSTPTVGAAYARFRGSLVGDGIEVIDLLHPVKSQASVPRLESIAGAGSLYRGIGSVIFLVGETGSEKIEVHHIKPIREPVESFAVIHDHSTGRSFNECEAQVRRDFAIIERLLAERGGEAAPGEIAAALDISSNAVKARMDPLVARGRLTDNGRGTRAKRYLLGGSD